MKTKIPKRIVDVAIISDVHLGTIGCRARELLRYLKSIRPGILVLNGDIIDIWQFRKSYFPKEHLMVIRYLTTLIAKKTRVVYITGNHDEMLRKFVPFRMGSFELVNKLVLELHGKKTWIFHGDVFDFTMQYSKWLSKLGSTGYDLLIRINSLLNSLLVLFGKEKVSFSKNVKNRVKSAVAYINRFEETAAGIAISKEYGYVACGHIHQPVIRTIQNGQGETVYLNSGDWIENLSSLEYYDGSWHLYHYYEDPLRKLPDEDDSPAEPLTDKVTFERLLEEFRLQ
ncbi:MAG TPA: UDP-2,3-diacylglucosamine diphosphatase [Bacteroidales bacterium]|nr:UDP-2,3-diacylglucosamine diphosphatase [Bacteroidales bacterium]